MANNEDDFFSFALGDAPGAGATLKPPAPAAPLAPQPVAPAAELPFPPPAPPKADAPSPVPAPASAPAPLQEPFFTIAPAARADLPIVGPVPELSDVSGELPAAGTKNAPKVWMGIGAALVLLVIGLVAARPGAEDAAAGAKRYNAPGGSAGRAVSTPKGEVRVPGRGRVAVEVEVLQDLDATPERRKVVCTVAPDTLVVLTSAEEGPDGMRVRISGSEAGCEGWLHAAKLAPADP